MRWMLCLVLFWLAQPVLATTAAAAGNSYRTQVEQALAQLPTDEPAKLGREVEQLLESPQFFGLAAAQRYRLLAVAAHLAAYTDQHLRALDLLLRALAVDPEQLEDWVLLVLLVQLENALGRPERSVGYLIETLDRLPHALKDLDDDLVFRLYNVTESGSSQRLQLLQALFGARAERRISYQSTLWYELALQLLQNDRVDAARPVVDAVEDAQIMIKMRADRRFDAVLDRDDPRNAAAARGQLAIQHSRAHSEANPRRLDLLVEHLNALEVLGRHEDILRLASISLAELHALGQDVEYEPIDHVRWLMNHRADALQALGRVEEGLVQLQLATELDDNPSQVLNLGAAYAYWQRPQEARAAIAKAGNMSGYGMMVQQSVEFMAAQMLKDAAGMAGALEYMREHRADAPLLLVRSLVRAGMLDEAAGIMVTMLESEQDRGEALLQLQRLQPGTGSVPPQRIRIWERLRKHPRVRQVVARVGRIEQHAIPVRFGD